MTGWGNRRQQRPAPGVELKDDATLFDVPAWRAGQTSALADVNTELDAQTALLTTIDADTGSIDSKLTIDANNNVKVALGAGAQLDAFGRQRVSEPYTIFDSKLVTDKQPLFYDEVVNSAVGASSTHNSGEASVSMTVTGSGDYVIRQTFMAFNYQPGKSQYILVTGVLGEPTASTESRIGYFNTFGAVAPYTTNRDGWYFGQDGTNKYVAISRAGTENKIVQANWNYDTLDGNGPSGVTLDWSENQIFFIDFEWLGLGITRMGVVHQGEFLFAHIFSHTNGDATFTGAYTATPNHSIRYEVRSTGGTLTMKHVCASVMSEGGIEPSGVTRTIDNDTTAITCTTTMEGILFFRLNSGNQCTSLELAKYGVLNTANNTANYRYSVILNPTIAGTALSWTSLSNSAIDYAIGQGDNTITGGIYLDGGYTSGNQPGNTLDANLLINPGLAIDGTQDVIALAVKTFSGSDTFVGSMSIRELTCG